MKNEGSVQHNTLKIKKKSFIVILNILGSRSTHILKLTNRKFFSLYLKNKLSIFVNDADYSNTLSESLPSGVSEVTSKTSDAITSIILHIDPLKVIVGDKKGTLSVWDLKIQKKITSVSIKMPVSNLLILPFINKLLVSSGFANRSLLILKVDSLEIDKTISFSSHITKMYRLSTRNSEEAEKVFCLSRKLFLIEITSCNKVTVLHSFNITHSAGVFIICSTFFSNKLFFSCFELGLSSYDLTNEKLSKSSHASPPHVIMSNIGGKLIVSGNANNEIDIWNEDLVHLYSFNLRKLYLMIPSSVVGFGNDSFVVGAYYGNVLFFKIIDNENYTACEYPLLTVKDSDGKETAVSSILKINEYQIIKVNFESNFFSVITLKPL